jgi:putative ABC transport system permease protein
VSGWRTALRIARREARRAKGRSVLVTAMIALPVAAVAFGAVTYDTTRLTPDEKADRLMGATQAAVIWPYDGPVHQHPTEPHFLSDVFVPAPSSTPPPAPSLDRLLALLPPGTTALTDQAGRLRVYTAAGIGTVNARMLDYADPLARGIYRPLSGRAPASADEVALTRAATRRLGAAVGGTVRLADGSRRFRVVGVVENPDDLKATTIVLRSGALPSQVLSNERRDLRYLVATPGPMTWADVEQLNRHGILAISRHVLEHPPSPAEAEFLRNFVEDSGAELGVGLAAGLAVLEIILLAGPAFAVGARRRRRDLALVAAAGGTPAHLRRIVLADGVVLGVLAAAAGLALGVVTAAAALPLIEDSSHVRSGAFRIFPAALVGLAGLAVVTGVLAALVPAWIAARQDVVTALAGRRGISRSRRRWLVLGGALGAAGAAVAAVGAWRIDWAIILIGLVVVELGLVLCTPAIVGLVARLGRVLSLAPRIALRDTSRNRTAAAPAISAVMAAVVGSLVIAVIVIASDERNRAGYRTLSQPGDVAIFDAGAGPKGSTVTERSLSPQVLEAVRSTLPVTEIHEIGLPGCNPECVVWARMPEARACPYDPSRDLTAAQQRAARRDPRCDGISDRNTYFGGIGGSGGGLTFVIDESAAAAVLHLTADDAAPVAAALRSGSVVVDDPRYLEEGRVTLALKAGPAGPRGIRTLTAPGFALSPRPPVPVALMTEETASSLGLISTPTVTLVTTSRVPTVDEQDRLQAALGDRFGVAVERGQQSNNTGLLVLAIVAGVITLGAAAIATGLAAADGRADLGTLAAVGASPRLRRMLSLSQAGVIAGLGSLIGAVAGLGAAEAVLFALNQREASVWPAPAPYPLAIPWVNVGMALVVVPLTAMLGAGLLTRSRLPIERRL